MSRCFSFPPPGFVMNGLFDGALVGLMKKKEKKAKKEKKKGRKRLKEKKQKKREKKEMECGDSEIRKLCDKRRRNDDGATENKKSEEHHEKRVNVNDDLEKSSFTEERQLIRSQNSYDRTLDSNKRQKRSPSPLRCPPFDDSRQYSNSESIVGIRLPVNRQKDPQVLIGNEQQPRYVSGRVLQHPCSTSSDTASKDRNFSNGSLEQLRLNLCKEEPSKEKLNPFSGSSKPSTKPELVRTPNKCGNVLWPPNVALQYQTLLEDWIPSSLQGVSVNADDGWLFRFKNPISAAVRRETSSAVMCQTQAQLTATWPKGCFLPEADVYALPFTVPF